MTQIVFQNVTSWEVNVCTDFQKDPGDLTVHVKDFLFYSIREMSEKDPCDLTVHQ